VHRQPHTYVTCCTLSSLSLPASQICRVSEASGDQVCTALWLACLIASHSRFAGVRTAACHQYRLTFHALGPPIAQGEGGLSLTRCAARSDGGRKHAQPNAQAAKSSEREEAARYRLARQDIGGGSRSFRPNQTLFGRCVVFVCALAATSPQSLMAQLLQLLLSPCMVLPIPPGLPLSPPAPPPPSHPSPRARAAPSRQK
jgi:hypothetical protein